MQCMCAFCINNAFTFHMCGENVNMQQKKVLKSHTITTWINVKKHFAKKRNVISFVRNNISNQI